MIANWTGLAPEERWWLYTTVNATSGHQDHGKDRGWRKAIKIAFAENPTGDLAPSALRVRPTPVQERCTPTSTRRGKKNRDAFEAKQERLPALSEMEPQ
jgi:hypothetical protein